MRGDGWQSFPGIGLLGLLLAAPFAAPPAGAADAHGNYTVLGGPGLVTCRDWLTDLHGSGSTRESQVEAWMGGFLSAYNLYGYPAKNVIEGRDPQALIDWAVRFCRANPTLTMAQTADMMIQSLLAAETKP